MPEGPRAEGRSEDEPAAADGDGARGAGWRDEAAWRAAWHALERHRHARAGFSLRSAFAADPGRAERLTRLLALGATEMLVDYSKQLVTDETLDLLLGLARASGLERARDEMFGGERINVTEGRAVLHVALRDMSGRPVTSGGEDVMPRVRDVRRRMRAFVEAVHSGAWRGHTGERITDVVNIGIGGSHLGPQMVVRALEPYAVDGIAVRFVSNVDGGAIARELARLDPATTLFLVASKTFTTQETMMNARTARAWLLSAAGDEAAVARHFVALSAATGEAARFGIPAGSVFEFWDWVGGRFSLWSAIGMPIALAVGYDGFERLLRGAHALDVHFRDAPLEANLPVLLGLLAVWNVDFLGAQSRAVLPYDESLEFLPAFLQQLDMESNGKRVRRHGAPVGYPTGPVVWGAPGTNGQHAFFQLLHQGTVLVPADFIAFARPHHGHLDHHRALLANFVAQTQALMRGRTTEEARARLSGPDADLLAAAKTFPGDRPTTSIVMPSLTPEALGALIALYEHQVFVQGVVWDVNSFDQMGVELGKELAAEVLPRLRVGADEEAPAAGEVDASTAGLIAYLNRHADAD